VIIKKNILNLLAGYKYYENDTMNLNKRFIGIEKNEDTFKIAKARINHNMI
jgi:hypothetical protein